MPALNLDLKPKGRGPSVRRAKDRYRDRSSGEETARKQEAREGRAREQPQQDEGLDLRRALEDAVARQEPWRKPVDVAGDFARAADGEGSEGHGGGGAGDAEPVIRISRAERSSEKKRWRDDDFERER
jgi:hypothetical protein